MRTYLQPLRRISRHAPLGIRFWDPAASMLVTDDLEVTAMPPGRPDLSRRAEMTPSGVFAFHRLPGIRTLEVSEPEPPAAVRSLSATLTTSGRFLISVRDRRERYQPCLFFVDLPHQGIYPVPPATSSPGGLPGFYLFSAPIRNPTPNLAVVRAQLVEKVSPSESRPAAFAVLEVHLLDSPSPAWLGIADKRGVVVVFMPLPAFTAPSSPSSPPSAIRTIGWDVQVRVRCTSPPLEPVKGFMTPLLADVLNQPPAQVHADLGTPGLPTAQLSARLFLGQPLLLQTAGKSELWIES